MVSQVCTDESNWWNKVIGNTDQKHSLYFLSQVLRLLRQILLLLFMLTDIISPIKDCRLYWTVLAKYRLYFGCSVWKPCIVPKINYSPLHTHTRTHLVSLNVNMLQSMHLNKPRCCRAMHSSICAESRILRTVENKFWTKTEISQNITGLYDYLLFTVSGLSEDLKIFHIWNTECFILCLEMLSSRDQMVSSLHLGLQIQ